MAAEKKELHEKSYFQRVGKDVPLVPRSLLSPRCKHISKVLLLLCDWRICVKNAFWRGACYSPHPPASSRELGRRKHIFFPHVFSSLLLLSSQAIDRQSRQIAGTIPPLLFSPLFFRSPHRHHMLISREEEKEHESKSVRNRFLCANSGYQKGVVVIRAKLVTVLLGNGICHIP